MVLPNARINARIGYGNSAHVSDGCRQQHCIQNCGQTAAEKDMVIFDSLYEVTIALSNGTIADPYDVSLRTETTKNTYRTQRST